MNFFFPRKKFAEPLDTPVYTTVHVMKEKSAILLVFHELDGDWQFLGGQIIEDYSKVAMVVGLQEIIKLDKSVLKVADLPKGCSARRKSFRDK